MDNFSGKTAVITGGASGIGAALALGCAAERMNVVLADVDTDGMQSIAAEIKEHGGRALAVRTDVSRLEDVEVLAEKSVSVFGAVDLLFNNAGVSGGGFVWSSTIDDWDWVLGVNLWGVIYGLMVFVPIMLRQGTEGHIVNTASMAGLVSPPGMGPYNVSKHGVIALSETLYHELAVTGARIGVSVLCPSFVKTRIHESDRNRPGDHTAVASDPMHDAVKAILHAAVEAGIPPETVADKTFEAIRANRFYILTHEDSKPAVKSHADDILQDRPPTPIAIPRRSE